MSYHYNSQDAGWAQQQQRQDSQEDAAPFWYPVADAEPQQHYAQRSYAQADTASGGTSSSSSRPNGVHIPQRSTSSPPRGTRSGSGSRSKAGASAAPPGSAPARGAEYYYSNSGSDAYAYGSAAGPSSGSGSGSRAELRTPGRERSVRVAFGAAPSPSSAAVALPLSPGRGPSNGAHSAATPSRSPVSPTWSTATTRVGTPGGAGSGFSGGGAGAGGSASGARYAAAMNGDGGQDASPKAGIARTLRGAASSPSLAAAVAKADALGGEGLAYRGGAGGSSGAYGDATHAKPPRARADDAWGHSHSVSISRSGSRPPPLLNAFAGSTAAADSAYLARSASGGASSTASSGAGAGGKAGARPLLQPSRSSEDAAHVLQAPTLAYHSYYSRSRGALSHSPDTTYDMSGSAADPDGSGAPPTPWSPTTATTAPRGPTRAPSGSSSKDGASSSVPSRDRNRNHRRAKSSAQSTAATTASALLQRSVLWWLDALLGASWTSWAFIAIVLLEAGVNISVEAILLSRFNMQRSIQMDVDKQRALPVFLLVFGAAHLYQLFLALDAVVNKNMILVVGMLIMNGCMLVYAGIQIGEIREVLGTGVVAGTGQHIPVQVLTGCIPGVVGAAELAFACLFVPLWKEYGWRIYKQIGADRDLKRRYLHYQIYVALLKFDFFVFCAYCLQLILIVLQRMDAERVITIIAPEFSLLALMLAGWSVRVENRTGIYAFLIGLGGALGYFCYKLMRIWEDKDGIYKEVYKSLSTFSILSIMLLLITFGMTVQCLRNFGRGLIAAIERIDLARKAGHRAQASNGGAMIFVPVDGGKKGEFQLNHRLSLD